MNTLFKVFIVGAVVLTAGVVFADTGKVIDILEGSVTVQLDGKNIFQKGDQVDLSYMAGVIEMLIGTYEVSHAQDNVFIAKEISLTMPPNKGMKVKVVKKQDVLQILDVGAMEQPDTDPRFIQERQGFSNNEPLPDIVFNQAAEADDVEIQGEVVEVMGQDVKIKLTSEGQARVGFSADLTFVTSQGTALPVGTWTVKSVDGQTVVAAPTVDAANPRVGLKALISNKKTEDKKRSMPVKNPGPDIFAENYDFNIDGPPQGADIFGGKEYGGQKSDFLLGIESSPFMTGEAPLFEDAPGTQQKTDPAGGWKRVTFESYKRELMAQLGTESQESARRAGSLAAPNKHWLGVEVKKNDSVVGQAYAAAPMGVRIVRVFRDSPAEAAGLEVADLIYKANGEELTSAQQLVNIVHNAPDGILTLDMQRDTQMLQKRIQLRKNSFLK